MYYQLIFYFLMVLSLNFLMNVNATYNQKKMQVLILLDTTKSMDRVKLELKDAIKSSIQLNSQYNAEFALASFRDKNYGPFGRSEDYCFCIHHDFTTDFASLDRKIDRLQFGGGYDTFENPFEAVLYSLRTPENMAERYPYSDRTLSWEFDDNDVKKVIYVITDQCGKFDHHIDFWYFNWYKYGRFDYSSYRNKGTWSLESAPSVDQCPDYRYPTLYMFRKSLEKRKIHLYIRVISDNNLPNCFWQLIHQTNVRIIYTSDINQLSIPILKLVEPDLYDRSNVGTVHYSKKYQNTDDSNNEYAMTFNKHKTIYSTRKEGSTGLSNSGTNYIHSTVVTKHCNNNTCFSTTESRQENTLNGDRVPFKFGVDGRKRVIYSNQSSHNNVKTSNNPTKQNGGANSNREQNSKKNGVHEVREVHSYTESNGDQSYFDNSLPLLSGNTRNTKGVQNIDDQNYQVSETIQTHNSNDFNYDVRDTNEYTHSSEDGGDETLGISSTQLRPYIHMNLNNVSNSDYQETSDSTNSGTRDLNKKRTSDSTNSGTQDLNKKGTSDSTNSGTQDLNKKGTSDSTSPPIATVAVASGGALLLLLLAGSGYMYYRRRKNHQLPGDFENTTDENNTVYDREVWSNHGVLAYK